MYAFFLHKKKKKEREQIRINSNSFPANFVSSSTSILTGTERGTLSTTPESKVASKLLPLYFLLFALSHSFTQSLTLKNSVC